MRTKMALPPEPIDDVIPKASACVLAKVSRVVQQDPAPPPPGQPPKRGAADVPGNDAPRQVVELEVGEVVFGGLAKAGAKVEVEKPAGDYALVVGNQGPFVLASAAALGGRPRILGRYGPDTWTVERIKHAAKAHGK
jgi:hypothetical protein